MMWTKGIVANKSVYLSGVEGIDPSTGECGQDVETQTTVALQKVSTRLGEAGTDVNHIVKLVAYVVGRKNLDGYRAARESWVKANSLTSPPDYASTLVLVDGLARPDMLIELDVTAVLP